MSETLDSVKKISIFKLKGKGYLDPFISSVSGFIFWNINGNPTGRVKFELNFNGNSEYPSPYLHLKYRKMGLLGGSWVVHDDKFELIKVRCPFGGHRWFFKCGYNNGKYCGRKVAILYMINDGFACRHCVNLSYDSCNENKNDRGTLLCLSLGKAIEDYSKLKRHYYSGKPTRKHRKYLKITNKYMNKSIINYTEMI
jgi:hypothetical protein